MTERPIFLLDRAGDAFVPDGYDVVSDEVAFLQQALSQKSLLIRGENLCQWARSLCQSRGWQVREVLSPSANLRRLCPSLSEGQSEKLFSEIKERYQELADSLSLDDLLFLLFPDTLWYEHVSQNHAARWLLWVAEHELPGHHQVLINQKASVWSVKAEEQEQRLYEITTSEPARCFLSNWIGLEAQIDTTRLGKFPLEVPNNWRDQACSQWSKEVVKQNGRLLDTLDDNRVSKELMELAAVKSCDYFLAHPQQLDEATLRCLSKYLPQERTQQLRRIFPPKVPIGLPATTEEIFSWFEDEYLPYRQWQVAYGDNQAQNRVNQLARSFAEWLVEFYPAALAGNQKQHLSFACSSEIPATKADYAVLWIVLDGLHYADALELAGYIKKHSTRLYLETQRVVVGALPTITKFAKPALVEGIPPERATANDETLKAKGYHLLSERLDPQRALQHAQKGYVYLWRIMEPDNSYHKSRDVEVIRSDVQAQLNKLAKSIAAAAEWVPNGVNLRVIVSTDHGRLLGSGRREIPVPSGMESHGRAAFGEASVAFRPAGYMFADPNQVLFLQASRFGLPIDCAVVLSEDVFMTNDNKTGTERFPHGGLFPEEVLIPWFTYVRDLKLPDIECVVSGSARARSASELSVSILNPSDAPVVVNHLSLSLGNTHSEFLFGTQLGPQCRLEKSIALDIWPSPEDVKRAEGTLHVALLTGTQFKQTVSIQLTSIDMYDRGDNILEDL